MKLEQDQKITLQNFVDECQCILNLRVGTAKIEERDISHIHAVRNKPITGGGADNITIYTKMAVEVVEFYCLLLY